MVGWELGKMPLFGCEEWAKGDRMGKAVWRLWTENRLDVAAGRTQDLRSWLVMMSAQWAPGTRGSSRALCIGNSVFPDLYLCPPV